MNRTTNFLLSVAVAVMLVLGAALAENKPSVSITRPLARAVVSGVQVEVEVAYHSNSGEPIVQAEVYIDRQLRFGGYIEPTLSGTSRFLWDTTLYSDGSHSLAAAAVDAAGNAGSVAINVKIGNVPLSTPAGQLPIAIVSPGEGEEVKGTVDVLLKVQENADVKWVSYFIDGDFWAARNFPPFLQRWDTTEYAEGKHVLSVAAFGPEDTRATASVTVFVNNSGQSLASAAIPEETEAQPPEEVVLMERLPGLGAAAFASPGEGTQPDLVSALEGVPLNTGLTPEEASALGGIAFTGPLAQETLVMLPRPPREYGSLPDEMMAVEAALTPEVGAAVPEALAEQPGPLSAAPPLPNTPVSPEAVTPEAALGPEPGEGATPPHAAEPAGTLVIMPEGAAPAPSSPLPPLAGSTAPEAGLTSGSAAPLVESAVGAPLVPSTPVAAPLPQPLVGAELTAPSETGLATTTPPVAAQPVEAPALTLVMLPTHRAEEELAPFAESVIPTSQPFNPPSIPGLPIVYYDGQPISFPDTPAHIFKGMTLVPLRFLIEHRGGTVKWFDEDQRVEALTADGAKLIQLQIGSKEVVVNGEKKVMPIRAYLLPPGRTIVPLRFFSEILDAQVVYDSSTGNLFLASHSSGTTAFAQTLTSQ